jgi:hypothetical protein
MGRRLVGWCVGLLLVGGAAYVAQGVLRDPDVGGYPQRIGFERPSDPLPARPGLLAGTLVDNDFGTGRTLAVTPTGRLYELPDGEPALSPSGTVLLTRHWDRHSPLEVYDLSSGESWAIGDLPRRTELGGVRWSTDEQHVLLAAAPLPSRDGGPVVVDLTTEEVTVLPSGSPAGFRAPDQAVTVAVADDGMVATTTDLATGASDTLALRLATAWTGDPDATATASVSPDGERLLLLESSRGHDGVRVFSLGDGRELDAWTFRGWDGCAPTWQGDDPVVPVRFEPGGGPRGWAGAQRLTDDGATSLVAVHPRLQSRCLLLSADALEAGPRWALLGTSTALVTWYAGPALLAGAVLALLVSALLWHRRVRSRGRPAG